MFLAERLHDVAAMEDGIHGGAPCSLWLRRRALQQRGALGSASPNEISKDQEERGPYSCEYGFPFKTNNYIYICTYFLNYIYYMILYNRIVISIDLLQQSFCSFELWPQDAGAARRCGEAGADAAPRR